MRYCTDDLFAIFARAGERRVAIAIPTNGIVRGNGTAVMGKGVALDAATRFPGIDHLLGTALRCNGNVVNELRPGVFSFPTKHHYRDGADLDLIERSAIDFRDATRDRDFVFLPRVGAGEGRLPWPAVSSVLARVFGDDPRIWIVSRRA